ncbi:MAG: DUF2235 domain-containing protein [Planctomycetota bacterium]|nr:MAG: DUF2235 domain-containing protein [Planctomycetota bacterium]
MKRLVICLDGTWNRADQEYEGVPCPTNVVQMAFRAAKRDGDVSQIVYYDQGVGTGNLLDRISGGAFGEGLESNIHDAYRFLVANYEPNDQLFLFGFSRGAFTARSLAGMIRKCGILRRSSVRHYRPAVGLYRSAQRPDDPDPQQFRREHSVCGGDPIDIHFVGVWDTVGALGIPMRGLRWLTRRDYQFHDTELSKSVKNAYHALAIDEHRAPFRPTLWAYVPKEGQTVEQVWFCGAHSDVGGGYREPGLSNIALTWMMEKAQAAGLSIDTEAAAAYPLVQDLKLPPHNSRTALYRLARALHRAIGVAMPISGQMPAAAPVSDPRQSLHESVRKRWDEDEGYRPASVRNYFKLVGDPRAKP